MKKNMVITEEATFYADLLKIYGLDADGVSEALDCYMKDLAINFLNQTVEMTKEEIQLRRLRKAS
ncbi:hypothetical protein MYX82_04490 [Acidobacteria bacterium AH-259-D05]|nr:hypothetical protein [Acidobacteria bacterium AH-259-D05]